MGISLEHVPSVNVFVEDQIGNGVIRINLQRMKEKSLGQIVLQDGVMSHGTAVVLTVTESELKMHMISAMFIIPVMSQFTRGGVIFHWMKIYAALLEMILT